MNALKQFDKIYSDNYQIMFGVAYKMVCNADDVRDIIQEVFVDLYTKLAKGHTIEFPKSWLYRTTSNKCIDFYRKHRKLQNEASIEKYEIADATPALVVQ